MNADISKEYGFWSNFMYMIKALWNYRKNAFIISYFRIAASVATSVLGIWLPKIVIETLGDHETAEVFLTRLVVMTILMIITNTGSYLFEHQFYKIIVEFWNKYFYMNKDWKILDMDYARTISPEGKMKIQKGHGAVGGNIFVNMVSIYPNLMDLVINIIGMSIFSAMLAVLHPAIIFLIILSYMVEITISIRVKRWEHKKNDQKAKINLKLDYILETINNPEHEKDIITYQMKKWINETTESFLSEKNGLENKIESKFLFQRETNCMLTFWRSLGGYLFLIYQMLNTKMTIGDFVLYFGVITGFGQWLERIILRARELSTANYKITDYRKLMEAKDTSNRGSGPAVPRIDEPVEIRIENLTFQYENSDHPILNNINLVIKKGEKLAIVGENGAGKTTLTKLICGLICPTSGQIFVNGTDIREFNRDEYYSIITALFQNVCVLPNSIAENIALCSKKDIDEEKMVKSAKIAGIYDKIMGLQKGFETNLVPSITTDGINLSGGELQKLTLARALYKNSSLIILDEPTAALDPIAESRMYMKYNQMVHNKTAIYISHRLSSTQFCDRIIYLENGQIIESGTHKELMAYGGKYKEVFDVQSYYYKESEELGNEKD